MAKQISYNAAEAIAPETAADPYLRPAFSTSNKLRRLLWTFCWALFCRRSPRPLHAWRAMWLRLFGAKIGPNARIYAGARIWAPWNLICGELVAIADEADIYNPAPIHFGSHAIVSQGAYVCGATHDFNDVRFPLLAYEMKLGAYSWICARACVAPGVNVGEGAVLGLAAIAARDLEPWGVYGGSPAVKIKERIRVIESDRPDSPSS